MRFISTILVSLMLIGLVGHPGEAQAKKKVHRKTSVSQPAYNPKYAAFVVDGDTGKILHQEDADKLRYPASLTKMMTIYLLFEALDRNKMSLDSNLRISEYAAGRPQTNMGLSGGDTMPVRDAILALIVRSANDVAVAVAENLAGSEDNFAKIMTARARQLGMKNTTFQNASGLPDPKQTTTAKDLALLGIALKKHYPQYFPYFARTEFTYNGKTYPGHNRVMYRYPGADGMKTGFVNASGFNLVTTASRRGVNLVGVVMGGQTGASRDNQMIKLLDEAFEKSAELRNRGYVAEYPNSNREAAQKYAASNDNTINDIIDDTAGEGDQTEANTAPAPQPAATTRPVPIASAVSPTTYETRANVRTLAAPQPGTATAAASQPFTKPGAATAFMPYPKAKPKR